MQANKLLILSQLIWATISVLPFALIDFDLLGHCELVEFKPHWWHFCSELKASLTSITQNVRQPSPYWLLSLIPTTSHTGSSQIHPNCRHKQHAHYKNPSSSILYLNEQVGYKAVEVIIILQCSYMSSSMNVFRKTCTVKTDGLF